MIGILASLISLAGIPTVFVGIWWLWRSWTFSEGATTVDAVVVRMEKPKRRRKIGERTITRPVFEYQGEVGPIQIPTQIFTNMQLINTGDHHPILINPHHPDYCRVAGKWLYPFGYAMIVGGLLMMWVLPRILLGMFRY